MSEPFDQLWKLPKTWHWVTMGDVSTIIGGGTPATNDAGNFGGAIPWITPADLTNHTAKYIYRGSRFITEKGLSDSGARWLPRGSVLFSSRAPIGYTAIAAQNVTTNQGFKSFALASEMVPDYVYHWLKSSKRIAEEMASGTTFLELSGAKAAQLPMPLPPAREQARIAEKLEELLSDLDAGVAELKAAQQKLQRYRQSLLKAAVEGALTAEWRAKNPPTETGAELLQRMLRERRARWEEQQLAKFAAHGKAPPKGWKDKYPEPQPPKTEGLPELPEGWVWVTVDCAGDVLLGRQRAPQYLTGRYTTKYLRVANIKDDRIDFGDIESMDFDDVHLVKYLLRPGDILVSEGQSPELVGQSAIFRGHSEPLCFQKTLHRFRAIPSLCLTDFAQLVFRSHVASGLFMRLASITTNIAHLTLEKFEAAPFPLPPVAEQLEIIDRASELQGDANALEQAAHAALCRVAIQRQNILLAAFRGDLAPQDPNDEPASVLLERLRAERSATAKPAKGERKSRKTKGAA